MEEMLTMCPDFLFSIGVLLHSSAVKHSLDVDVDHFVSFLNLEILEKAQGLETSIVNEDIDGTPLFHDSVIECVTFGLYCDIQFLNENFSSIFDDLALQ